MPELEPKNVNGHIEAFENNKFKFSSDNYEEYLKDKYKYEMEEKLQ